MKKFILLPVWALSAMVIQFKKNHPWHGLKFDKFCQGATSTALVIGVFIWMQVPFLAVLIWSVL